MYFGLNKYNLSKALFIIQTSLNLQYVKLLVAPNCLQNNAFVTKRFFGII